MPAPMMDTYAPPELVFDHGKGVRLFTETGDSYLDFISGIAVNCLGHAHPKAVAALTEQAGKLWPFSNLFRVPAGIELADKLTAATFADRVFFTNSGAEAMECALEMPMLGAVLNANNMRLDVGTSAYILEHGEAKVLLVDTEFSAMAAEAVAQSGRDVLVVDIEDSEGPGGDGARAAAGAARDLDGHDPRPGPGAWRNGAAVADRHERLHHQPARRYPRPGNGFADTDLHLGRQPGTRFHGADFGSDPRAARLPDRDEHDRDILAQQA